MCWGAGGEAEWAGASKHQRGLCWGTRLCTSRLPHSEPQSSLLLLFHFPIGDDRSQAVLWGMRHTELTVKPPPSRANDQDLPFKVFSQQEATFPIDWSWWVRETPLTYACARTQVPYSRAETLGPPSPGGRRGGGEDPPNALPQLTRPTRREVWGRWVPWALGMGPQEPESPLF